MTDKEMYNRIQSRLSAAEFDQQHDKMLLRIKRFSIHMPAIVMNEISKKATETQEFAECSAARARFLVAHRHCVWLLERTTDFFYVRAGMLQNNVGKQMALQMRLGRANGFQDLPFKYCEKMSEWIINDTRLIQFKSARQVAVTSALYALPLISWGEEINKLQEEVIEVIQMEVDTTIEWWENEKDNVRFD